MTQYHAYPLIRAPKLDVERRVYVLPRSLVEQVRSYALERGLQSEVAAARELLTLALDEHDARQAARSAA